jgi:hypothetical protein
MFKLNTKIKLTFILIIILSCFISNAQVKVYSFTQSLVGYVPLTGTPSVAFSATPTAWDDNAPVLVTLPFTFNFDGLPYTQFYVSPNGFITFGATAPTGTNYTPLSNVATYNGAISALGIDLISNGSDIVYNTIGTAPNRIMVIQWTDAVRKVATGNFNFQIRLKEVNSSIELAYGLCQPTGTTVALAQVGLRGPNNNFVQSNVNNLSQTINTVWLNNNSTSFASTSTMRTRDIAYPDLGLLYSYIPPPACVTPSSQPSGLLIGSTSITHNSFVGNSFTPASPAPTNYLVLRSTINVAPVASQVIDRTYYNVGSVIAANYTVVSNTSATTFTQTGLLPDTTYYYWVIPFNDICIGAPFYNLTGIISNFATTCSQATVAAAATNVGGNNFDANWSVVPTATEYRIDVSTNATFSTFVPGYNNLSVGTVNTITISGLSSLTTYYYRVRAIGIGCVVNSNTITTTTICGSYPIPYTENFDLLPNGVVPNCYVRVNANADPIQWQTQSINVSSAPRSLYLGKSLTSNADDWFFLPGLNLTGGVSHRLFFRYNTGNNASFTENLKVRLGTGSSPAAMTETLLDLANINNSVFQIAIVDFIPVTTGTYYIGFQGYSLMNQSYLVVDDISVTISPTCFEPSDVTIDSVGTSTASISWTASFPAPLNGYEYYLSTSATVPITSTVPTGTVAAGVTSLNLTGLTPSSTYYFWIRGNCGPTDKSVWTPTETFNTDCAIPTILSTTPSTRCGNGTLTLGATSSTGSTISWYNAPTNGTLLTNGNSFTTPTIATTTTYYVQAKSFGSIAKVGPTSPANQGGTTGVQNYQAFISFNVTSDTSLISVDVYPYVSGQAGQLKLRNSSNVTLATYPFFTAFAGGNTAQIIPINYSLAPGNYNLYFEILPAAGVKMNTNNAIYPYTSAVANITGNSTDSSFNLGLYNWKFTTECISPRVPVTATVTSPPALSLSSTTSTICQGFSTPVVNVIGAAAYNTLVWTPSTGISGSIATGFTFNPNVTTTYVLNANQTSGSLCGNFVTYTVVVNPVPPPISIIPSAVTICNNSIQPLNGSAAASAAVPIYTQDFNTTAPGWVVANTSIGGNVLASQWTLRPNNYNYSSAFWNVTFQSNDSSQFFLANSDAQSASPGTLTRTTLTSPSFNLAGYTSVSLSFWHYIRYTLDIDLVELSTNGGTTWTTIKSYNSNQGTATAFKNEIIDLSAYLGQTNVKIRFNFTSNWGYVWAVDNFQVSGTLATALTWSPITDLYQDAAATIPYVAGVPLSVVYSKPNANITYTATLTGANGCLNTNTSTITVIPNTVAGTISANQIICSNTPVLPITLTGNIGSVLNWQYADDAAFTINVTNIANTTSTLSVAQMGSFTTIRYFRAVVKNGICSTLNSNVVFVEFRSTTWNGTAWSNGLPDSTKKVIFNGNYSSTGDISACSVVIQSGNIVFNSNHTLAIENELNVNSGTLTFENNASLLQINNVINTGNITYKRNTTLMKKYDFTYWSTPVSPQTLLNLSPLTLFDKYFEFNPTIGNWATVPANNLMNIGKGYIIRAPQSFDPVTPAIFNASFFGIPNNGTYTTPILVSTSNFNLIGNPYPSALNADAFLSFASNVPIVDATIYLWTHNTPVTANQYTSNDYAAYNYLGGVGTSSAPNAGVNNTVPNGKIATGQSFFIKGLNNGNATFTNSMRISGNNNQFFRMSDANKTNSSEFEKHRIWIDIVDANNAYKQTLIGYSDFASLGIDRGFDGDFIDAGNTVAIYSLIGNRKLSIQGRSLPFLTTDSVPLGYKASTSGNFTISLYNVDGLFVNQNIYLKDNVLNSIHNLKQSNYNFVSDAGTFENRFEIIYQNTTLNTTNFNIENSVVLYKNQTNEIVVNSGSYQMDEINVFDTLGRLIYSKSKINNSEFKLKLETNQIVLIQIKTIEGFEVVKKYIN